MESKQKLDLFAAKETYIKFLICKDFCIQILSYLIGYLELKKKVHI